MSFKKEFEWHFTKDEMPKLPNGARNVNLFCVAESGWVTTLGYSKYGFNTSDYGQAEDREQKSQIPVRAWAYIPDDWNETFFPEESEAADETV